MLPTDFAIFSPSIWSIPLCIHSRASGAARRRASAPASFSWWGKTRSLPPPWISKSSAEQLLRHRRALDVPARAAAPPRRVPRGVLALLMRLPEREVERVLLAVGPLDALALVHLVDGRRDSAP